MDAQTWTEPPPPCRRACVTSRVSPRCLQSLTRPSFTNRRNRDSSVHTTLRKRSSVQKTWFWAQRYRASLLASDSKGFIGHLNWRNPASLSLLRTVHLLTLSFHKRNNDVELASLLPVAILTKMRLLRLLVFGGRPDDVLLTTVSDWRNWVHQRATICLLTPNFLI